MGSGEQIRQQKISAAVESLLTFAILIFTYLQLILTISFQEGLFGWVKLFGSVFITIVYAFFIWKAYKISLPTLLEVEAYYRDGDKLSTKVPKRYPDLDESSGS